MDSQEAHSRRHWPSRSMLTFLVNVVLHCVQVACLAILVARNRQHKALASWSGGMIPNLLALKFNLLPSAIFKIYNILLAFLTQRLALEREARVEQTLTDIHDKTSAWMGEMQAILALVQQNPFKSATFWRIWFISLYLLCITVLCTAASSIVTYVWRPGEQTYLDITHLLPNITTDNVKDGYPALSILPVMDRMGVVGALGLWNNIVFNPPYPQDGIVDRVSAVRFNVTCQALSNAHQSGPVKVNISTSTITFPFHIDDTLQDVEFSLANRMINIIGVDRLNNADNQLSPPTLLLASTIPIADSLNGSYKSVSALMPPLAFSECDTQNCLSHSQTQILACDMRTTFLNISVHGSDGVPANSIELLQLNNTWSTWTGPPEPQEPSQTTLGAFADLSPASNTRYDIALFNSSAKGTYMQTLLEESVMGDLGVEYVRDPSASLDLSDVNLALGRALALVYWRASLTLSGLATTSTQSTSSPPNPGGYDILVNSYTPFISLIASILALILTTMLTWPATEIGLEKFPTNIGVLQMFWRAGIDRGEVAMTLRSRVKDPTTYNLRLEGCQYKMHKDGSIARYDDFMLDSNIGRGEHAQVKAVRVIGVGSRRPDLPSHERESAGAWQSSTTAADDGHVDSASESA